MIASTATENGKGNEDNKGMVAPNKEEHRPLLWVADAAIALAVPSLCVAIAVVLGRLNKSGKPFPSNVEDQGDFTTFEALLLMIAALMAAGIGFFARRRLRGRTEDIVRNGDQEPAKDTATAPLESTVTESRQHEGPSSSDPCPQHHDEGPQDATEEQPEQGIVPQLPHEIKNVVIPTRNESSSLSTSSSSPSLAVVVPEDDKDMEVTLEGNKMETPPSADATPARSRGALRFAQPNSVWAIGLDDSPIQRKMLVHIFRKSGVPKTRQLILGEKPDEVEEFSSSVLDLVQKHKTARFLCVVDEILDYTYNDGTCIPPPSASNSGGGVQHNYISGSLTMKKVLDKLSEDQRRRVCAVVRSANDTQEDVERSMERAHGFISKCHVQRDEVREMLATIWRNRFSKEGGGEQEVVSLVETELSSRGETAAGDGSGMVSREDLLESLASVERLFERIGELDDDNWPLLWAALHSLKGDVSMVEGVDDLDQVVVHICDLRGKQLPPNLQTKWNDIQRLVRTGAQCLASRNASRPTSAADS